MPARAQWGVAVRLADGRRLYWCPPGSRRGGQDQWSPRVSQAIRFAAREDAERVIAEFDKTAAVSEYLVVRAAPMMAKGLLPRGVVNPSGSWKSESAVANASGNGSRTPRCPEYDPPARRNKGGPSCTATTTPRHPFEPSSKRRRGFPLASLALSGAIASSASTPNSSRNSAGTTCARAARAAAFKRCCLQTGRFDGSPRGYFF